MPQRPPIVMVDRIADVTETGANSGLTILAENIFASDGYLAESGIIEHIAQSCACFAGYKGFAKGEAPKLGYIGELKKLSIPALPKVGDTLSTRLEVMGEAAGVTLMNAETRVGETLIAEGRMKIFIKED